MNDERQIIHDIFQRTLIKGLTMKMQYLDGYPNNDASLSIDLHSDTLDNELVAKLQKQCLAEAAKADERKSVAAFMFIRRVFEENMFVSCYDEMRSVRDMFRSNVMKLSPKQGTAKLSISVGLYSAMCVFVVPDEYPQASVTFELKKSNYPKYVTKSVEALADNLVRKMSQGIDPMDRGHSDDDEGDSVQQRDAISTRELHNIKSDMKYLKQTADLRELGSDDKIMRRTLSRMTKKETQAIEAELKKAADEEEQRRRRAFELKQHEHALPHLLRLMSLIDEKLRKLPTVKCQVCDKELLSKSPDKQKQKKTSDPTYPLRVTCGHWFHYKCLDHQLTTPPFIRQCTICGKRVAHHKWPSDVAQLERSYTQKRAKERELGEIGDFLGL